jgi:hypothetical protein
MREGASPMNHSCAATRIFAPLGAVKQGDPLQSSTL